jgi:gluconate 2-dehydrogenase gamma chain
MSDEKGKGPEDLGRAGAAEDSEAPDRRARSSEDRSLPLGEPRPGADRSLPVLGQPHPDGSGALPMDRRHALKVMALAAAAPSLATCAPGDEPAAAEDLPAPTSNPMASGTAWDPDLIAPTIAWNRQLTDDELASLAALCDVILPEDDRSPAASAVGAHDFIDEWVSAPYEGNERDLVMVRGGLIWLDREAAERFGPGLRFRDLDMKQKHAICDDICWTGNAAAGFESAARFFDRVRDLTSTAFWTTNEGMADLQYVGNVPLPRWDPPPPEVLRHIGLV